MYACVKTVCCNFQLMVCKHKFPIFIFFLLKLKNSQKLGHYAFRSTRFFTFCLILVGTRTKELPHPIPLSCPPPPHYVK